MADFERFDAEHERLWRSMKVVRDQAALTRMAAVIMKHKAVYQAVQKATGVPWQMVAVIHIREAGLSDVGRWECVLHNGERIVGTEQVTKLVPKGHGPFLTFTAAAIHALRLKGFHQIAKWTPGKMLSALEPYNGYGYRHGPLIRGGPERAPPMRSSYLWASTNHQQLGKYTRDHYFDPDVMDSQVGCAALLLYLGIEQGDNAAEVVVPTGGAGGVVAYGVQQGWGWDEIAIAAIAVAVVAFIAVKILKKAKEK